MSDQGRHDKANTKPGDLRAETAKRVGLTVDEQNRCRREGFSAAVRALRAIEKAYGSDRMQEIRPSNMLIETAERRWGPDWEVDG